MEKAQFHQRKIMNRHGPLMRTSEPLWGNFLSSNTPMGNVILQNRWKHLSLCHKEVSSAILDIIFAAGLLILTSEMMLLSNDMKSGRSMSCSYHWTVRQMWIDASAGLKGQLIKLSNFAGLEYHAWYQVALLSPSENLRGGRKVMRTYADFSLSMK
jgi:hypothetical protein